MVDINTRDGNKECFSGSASLGLLAGKFSIEGPIVKNRTSFTLSGRRSWADAFMGKLQDKDSGITTFYFYDVNAKVHHRFSDKTSLWVSAYNGHDRLKSTLAYKSGRESWTEDQLRWKWGNILVAARLGTSLSGNLFMNANLSYNRYRFSSGEMMTLPLMTGEDAQVPDVTVPLGGYNRFDHRNNYRKPSYHRLDLGVISSRERRVTRDATACGT